MDAQTRKIKLDSTLHLQFPFCIQRVKLLTASL